MKKLRDEKVRTIEPKHSSEEHWKGVLQAMNQATLFPLNDSCSWYLGANIPGKKREPLNYIGGIVSYAQSFKEGTKDWANFDVVKENGSRGEVAPEQIPPLR